MNYAQFAYSNVSAKTRIPYRIRTSDTMPVPDSALATRFQQHWGIGAHKFVDLHANSAWAQEPNIVLHKPVRVVRVLEAGQARNNVGRMRISGRMADVCAELDRLAARETSGLA